MEFTLQIIIVITCLICGIYKGCIGLGLYSGIGILILVFIFELNPGNPPVEIILILIAVIITSATLQASGGLKILLYISEKILHHNPKYITLLAPLITCLLTILCGTGHTVYTLLPIIYNISIKNNIRPERAMVASSIGSQMGIIASPISVATTSLITMLNVSEGNNISFLTLLSITMPATLCGILVIGIFSYFRGKDLKKDNNFLYFINCKNNRDYVYGNSQKIIKKKLSKRDWVPILIFIINIIIIILFGSIIELRPGEGVNKLSMACIIQICMLCCGALIIISNNIQIDQISNNDIFRSGMTAIIAIYGTAWMTNTLFINYLSQIKNIIFYCIQIYPWTYAIILLILSQFVNSQATTLVMTVPVALSIGIHPLIIIATAPACYGYYILPTYPSDLATIQFDKSGTTKIGRWIINHSFLSVGLLGVSVSCLTGWLLVNNVYNLI